ncbi:RNA polymerase sigma-70 factor [Chryseobacterium contaminans]|nr:RNA polymerase sigma-70 factor [Chryseobacterium contaminans]SHL24515.1 RNA polymerase sigma-70 factor, ECF subfamily [Chryseobacterium contaminans]
MSSLSLKEYENAFNTLYPALCVFSNTYIQDLDMAKDIVQEVFIKIWEKKIQLQDEAAIKSYFYMAVKNRSLDYLKSKHIKATRSISDEDIAQMETDSFFFREVAVSDISMIIENAVNTLPPKCAEVIRLSIGGMSNIEISEKLGISINTIKTHKKNAYKFLKPLLKDSFLLFVFVFKIRN